MNSPVQLTGLVWYAPEDFDEAKAIMEDGHTLHRTYAEWHAAAENGERHLRGKGVKVVRAYIRPAEFVAWCGTHGHQINAKGRTEFANWTAKEAYRSGKI